jgi:hypothetical protein
MGKVKRYSSMGKVTAYLHTLEEYYDLEIECRYDGANAAVEHCYYMRVVAYDKDDRSAERSPLCYGRYMINDSTPQKREATWTYALTDFTYQGFELYCSRYPNNAPSSPAAP